VPPPRAIRSGIPYLFNSYKNWDISGYRDDEFIILSIAVRRNQVRRGDIIAGNGSYDVWQGS